jgi:preprotein translocase subunit SecB
MANENGNGNAAAQAQAAQAGPSLDVLAQYIKDLSFENPKAPGSMTDQRPKQPSINFNVQVNAQPVGDLGVEVELKLEARAVEADAVIFNLELVYAGVFRIRNVPQEQLHPFILIECPRLLFPFARQIVAETISSGGFPPVMLGMIDFAHLYRQRAAQQAANA